jgi:hypothetical protein
MKPYRNTSWKWLGRIKVLVLSIAKDTFAMDGNEDVVDDHEEPAT